MLVAPGAALSASLAQVAASTQALPPASQLHCQAHNIVHLAVGIALASGALLLRRAMAGVVVPAVLTRLAQLPERR